MKRSKSLIEAREDLGKACEDLWKEVRKPIEKLLDYIIKIFRL